MHILLNSLHTIIRKHDSKQPELITASLNKLQTKQLTCRTNKGLFIIVNSEKYEGNDMSGGNYVFSINKLKCRKSNNTTHKKGFSSNH